MELLKNANEEIILINPFIDEDLTKKIGDNLNGKKLKILLKTSNFDDIKGISILKSLSNYGAEIRLINNLNARILIFDSDKIIFTSSSLTEASLNSNIESVVLINDEKFVANEILPSIRKYWEKGKTIDINTIKKSQKLSNHEKYRKIAGKLMVNSSLTKEEILLVIQEYFPNKANIYSVFSEGLTYSFRSEHPFINTGIYLKNVSKIYPDFTESIFYNSSAKMFKNIILEKKEHKVKIRNSMEYHKVQNEFIENFNIKPPKSANIFKAILNDSDGTQKMMENPKYYVRVTEIFPSFKKELQMVILKNYERKIEGLEKKNTTRS